MPRRHHHRRLPVTFGLLVVALGGVSLGAAPAGAQSDFYNLDKHRPLRVEDAYTAKQWAFEIQGSPLALTQERGGALRMSPHLELKHGLLPGMEISAGLGLDHVRDGGATETSLGSVELSSLVNLWVEGSALPAAGIRVTGHVPTSSDAHGHLELRGILTRTLGGPVRAHLNGALHLGADRAEDGWVGLALDRVLPFRHILLLAEGWLSFPREGSRTLHTTAGARYQLSPTLVLDTGVGRGWTGSRRSAWELTFGITHEFGIRARIPGGSTP